MSEALTAAMVCDALVASLEAQHGRLVARAEKIRAEATHEEARPENDKDTRAIEQSYLARGQAMRTEELGEAVQRAQVLRGALPAAGGPVSVGNIALVLVDDEERWFFVAPVAGGTKLEVDGTLVLVVTPKAPVGRALVGKHEDDTFELRVAGTLREYEILEIR